MRITAWVGGGQNVNDRPEYHVRYISQPVESSEFVPLIFKAMIQSPENLGEIRPLSR